MIDLKTLIKNNLDASPHVADELVELTTIRNKARLYRYLQNPECEIDCFDSLLRMVRHLFPDEEFEIMDAYIRTLDPNQVLARHSLEYADRNRLDGLYDYMLNKLKSSNHRESQDWGRLHEIEYKRARREISNQNFPDLIHQMKFKSPEMRVYSQITLMYCYYDMRKIQKMKEAAPIIQKQISKLKSPFIRTSFMLRMALVMTGVSYHLGKMENIRLYGQIILDRPGEIRLKGLVHQFIGNSYIFSNYERSLYHFTKAEEYCSNESLALGIKRSRNFLANYWGKIPPYLDYVSKEIPDIHEVVFHHIRSGRMIDALNLLKSTKFEDLTLSQKGFHMFYKGIALNDRDCLFKSIEYFTQANERFYINLPLLELERIGENPEIVRALRLS
ncbi:hypothetical protein IM538_21730 [Cytobacillus suaedae]|nr:hypothetical protein IM538_21730 [Cytobacillus suaedae]